MYTLPEYETNKMFVHKYCIDYLNTSENNIKEAMVNSGRCEIVVCLGYQYGYQCKLYVNGSVVEIDKMDTEVFNHIKNIRNYRQNYLACNMLMQKIIKEIIVDKICIGVEKKSIRYITPACDYVYYLVFKLKWISEGGVKKYVLSVHRTSRRVYSYAKTFYIRPSTSTVKSARVKEITLTI